MTKPKRTKKQPKPGFEPGPLAACIAEIERGPRCSACGRSVRESGHECRA